ncbi:MAG: heparinase II/III family protein [Candidatus Hodarchaeota archaeon]
MNRSNQAGKIKKAKIPLLISLLIITLVSLNTALLVLSLLMFPQNGGFQRSLLYIRPDPANNKTGYFVIIDELDASSRNFDIDWISHGRGTLNVDEATTSISFTTQSYLSSDMIMANISFLSPVQSFTEKQGYFYPEMDNDADDLLSPYVKARYSGSQHPLFGTVIYPKNLSDATPVPAVQPVSTGEIGMIGTTDLVYYQDSRNLCTFNTPDDITSDAKVLFIRKDGSGSIDYFFAQDLTKLSFNSIPIFESSAPVGSLLMRNDNSSNKMSGVINVADSCSLTINTSFNVESVVFNSRNTTFQQVGGLVIFTAPESGSFLIQDTTYTGTEVHDEKNPLLSPVPAVQRPNAASWGFDLQLLDGKQHPYLSFNETGLDTLKQRIGNSTEPWNSWYGAFTSSANYYSSTLVENWSQNDREWGTRVLTMKFLVDDWQNCSDKLTELLLDMDSVADSYSQDLGRASAVESYSLAYDAIYNNLSATERATIESLLREHVEPLVKIDKYYDNNHQVVDAGALGLAGLVLKDKSYVDVATDALLRYFYEKVRMDGGSHEGQSYLGFAIKLSSEFIYAMKHLGGYNFYEDPKYFRALEFMARSLSPLATPPQFEDGDSNPRTSEVLLHAANHVEKLTLAGEFKWLWERRQNNSALAGLGYYDYLNGSFPDYRRIVLYTDAINASKPTYGTDIFGDANLAFFRSNYSEEAIYMSISCKDYYQSHPHYDENSFELWAYGAWVLINPGYPNWGRENHDYCISTEASNTLLVNGMGQLAPHAGGFKSAISSPYFDFVQADASQAYDSPGSWENVPVLYTLIIITFGLLGTSAILFFHARRSKRGTDSQPLASSKDDMRGESFLAFMKTALVSPRLAQEEAINHPNETNVKLLNMLLAGTNAFFIVLYLVTLINEFNYFLEAVNLPFDALIVYIIEIAAMILFALISFVIFKAFMKWYSKIALKMVASNVPGFSPRKQWMKNATTISLAWYLVGSIASGIIMLFTSITGFANFIASIFETISGFYEAFDLMFQQVSEMITVLCFTMIYNTVFIIITVDSLGYALHLESGGSITRNNGRKIALASVLIIISIIIILILTPFIITGGLLSQIGVEALVGG